MDDNEYCWGNFKDYCDDNGISFDHKDDWEPYWEIWKTAIDAYIASQDRQ